MSAFLQRLPLELRYEIYDDLLLAETPAPPDFDTQNAVLTEHHDYWREFQVAIRDPTPTSLTLQLCCRQMHSEIQSFLQVWLKKHKATYKLDLKFHKRFIPQAVWTHVPVPVKLIDRLEIHLSNHDMFIQYCCGPVSPKFHLLVRLIATFLRTGPSLEEGSVEKPIPFLSEIVVSYHDPRTPPFHRSPEQLFERLSRMVASFASQALRGLAAKAVTVWDQAPQSIPARVESVPGDPEDHRTRQLIQLAWINSDLPKDWDITWRAAYLRNWAMNSVLGYEQFPTLRGEELQWDRWRPQRPSGAPYVRGSRRASANGSAG